ncbi:hypothetical protein D3C84_1029530 [compost metagenome]
MPSAAWLASIFARASSVSTASCRLAIVRLFFMAPAKSTATTGNTTLPKVLLIVATCSASACSAFCLMLVFTRSS